MGSVEEKERAVTARLRNTKYEEILMTKTKALKNFIKKFFSYDAIGNSVATVLTDATENASGGGGFNCDEVLRTIDDETVALEKSDQDGEEEYGAILSVTKKLLMSDDDARNKQKVASLLPKHYVVTFDGKTYDLPQNLSGSGIVYGEIGQTIPPNPAFNKYPVAISLNLLPKSQESGRFTVGFSALSNLPGEHSIKIEEPVSLVSTTPYFDDAVMKVMTDQNRVYEIPETKVETETMTEEIHDVGPVEFYYCDITNNIIMDNVIGTTPISVGVTVDGITLEFGLDQFKNLQGESMTEVSDILEQYGFAFMNDSQNQRCLMFFQDPGPHVISLFFNTKSDVDGGEGTLPVVLNITYEQPEGDDVRYPKSVAFSKTYAEIMNALDNGQKIAFTSADYPGIPFMYNDHNENGYFEVYRLRPVSIVSTSDDTGDYVSKDYMMVETYELSSKNNKYAKYKLIEVQSPK